MIKLTKIIAILILFLGITRIGLSNIAFAQTVTGAVIGQVVDQDRKPIVGALVRIINTNNGFDYGKRTNPEGYYRFEFLPAGEYKIVAERDGYQTTYISQYIIEVNREKSLKPPPIQMIPISATTQASTSQDSGLTQANTTDATLRGNINAKFALSLPLNGIRSFDNLALLFPGIAPISTTTNGPGIGASTETTQQFSINGQRARSNNFTVDGSDNNDQEVGIRRQGFISVIPQPIESITELQVSTSLADTEAGRNTGGQVNVVSSSGTNQFHGNFYNFFTDSKLNSRDFFDLKNSSKNPFTRSQFGGVTGFPILKDRLFLLTAFEQQVLNRTQTEHFSVPTLDQRNKSLQFANSKSILGQDILDPSFYPLPNNPYGPYGQNTLTKILPASGRGTVFSLRSDYKLSSSVLSVKYNFTDDDRRISSIDNAINSSIDALARTQNLATIFNTELSEKLSNQIRFSYGRTSIGFNEVSGNPLIFQSKSTGTDLTGDGISDGRTGPIGRLVLFPFSPIGIDPHKFPQKRANNTFQFADTTVFSQGRNKLKFGTDIRRVQINSSLDQDYRAQIFFAPGFARLADGALKIASSIDFAALGLPNDIFQALAVTPDSTLGLRFTELNFFVNDQFQVSNRLTVGFGLRYERNTVPTDVTGRLEKSLTFKTSDLPTFNPDSSFSSTFLNSFNAQHQFLDGRTKIFDADNNNFAARAGFALDLTSNGRMSLRGGYGMFYDPMLTTVVSQSRNAFPNFIPVNFGSSVLFPEFLKANPAFIRFGEDLSTPLILPGTINTIGLPKDQLISGIGQLLTIGGFFVGSGFGAGITLPEKQLRMPYVHQYSVSLEKIFSSSYVASISYVGTYGRKLLRVRTPNGGQVTPLVLRFSENSDVPLIVPALSRPNKFLGAVTVFEGSAASSYHALQASLSKNFSNGLGFQISYTYAHAIDDVSDVFDSSKSSSLAQDETYIKEGLLAEQGNADFDIRHRFVGSWQYELRGIKFSGIATFQTGQPFTVISGIDTNFDGNLNDRLNSTNGLTLVNNGAIKILRSPSIDPLQFIVQPSIENPLNGKIGRNTFRSSGIASVDLAISKELTLKESQKLVLRLEGFNVLNRTHFNTPVRILESPAFGSSVSTSLSARTLQFAVRYLF